MWPYQQCNLNSFVLLIVSIIFPELPKLFLWWWRQPGTRTGRNSLVLEMNISSSLNWIEMGWRRQGGWRTVLIVVGTQQRLFPEKRKKEGKRRSLSVLLEFIEVFVPSQYMRLCSWGHAPNKLFLRICQKGSGSTYFLPEARCVVPFFDHQMWMLSYQSMPVNLFGAEDSKDSEFWAVAIESAVTTVPSRLQKQPSSPPFVFFSFIFSSWVRVSLQGPSFLCRQS